MSYSGIYVPSLTRLRGPERAVDVFDTTMSGQIGKVEEEALHLDGGAFFEKRLHGRGPEIVKAVHQLLRLNEIAAARCQIQAFHDCPRSG